MQTSQTIFIIINIIITLLGVAMVIYVINLHRRRKQQIIRLQQQHAATLQHGHWFPIRYANMKRYRRWLKFFPWEHNGILHIADDIIYVYLDDDSVIAMHVNQTQAHWIGQNHWPNGALSWFCLKNADKEHYLTSETGLTIIRSRQSTLAIFNQLADVVTITNPAPYETAFAIEKNPHALLSVIVFFILLFYYLIDNFFILNEEFVTWPTKLIFVSTGVLMLLASYFYMMRNNVPKIESTIIALLLCGATVCALYPGLRRVSQMIDTEGLQSYRYTFSDTRLLMPEDRDMPRLTLATVKRDRAFWDQYKTGDHYDVKLRHSILGFYLIDMEPIYGQMREFYRRQSELKQQTISE